MRKDKYVCWKEGKEPEVIEAYSLEEALWYYDFKCIDFKDFFWNLPKDYKCYQLRDEVSLLKFNHTSGFSEYLYGEHVHLVPQPDTLTVDVNFQGDVNFSFNGTSFKLTQEQFEEICNNRDKCGYVQFRQEREEQHAELKKAMEEYKQS